MSKSLRSIRHLADGHSGPAARQPSRVGAIIKAERPCPRIAGTSVPDLPSPLSDFTEADLDAAAGIVRDFAPSVGCVRVQLSDGSWVKTGTAFRVPGGPRRMVTARHVLSAMMSEQSSVAAANPFQVNGALRRASVAFDDDAQDTTFGIGAMIWAHPKWDMLIFDLDADPGCPELEMETAVGWGEADDNPVCIISYPILAAHQDMPLSGTVIGAPLGVKRLSVGRATCNQSTAPVAPRAPAARYADQHDATTLPGSSGAPVIDLRTGRVVGLHFHGRDLHRDLPFNSNFAVNLPLALAERSLRRAVCDPALPLANAVPIRWQPSKSFDRGVSEAALGADAGALESVFPRASSPAFAAIIPDPPDFRDLHYRPSLGIARDTLVPPPGALPPPGEQKGEPSCAGFALAAAINVDLIRAGRARPVSERMLYEMARLHDEWADDAAGGSSLRGAIKGFFHNGVCSAATARYRPGQIDWTFSIDAAKDARATTLGAYYRLRPSITDFQSALSECGAVVVSAHVHSGWVRPKTRPIGHIPFRKGRIGTHAFAIVGYDREGFIILNSWGKKWSDWKNRPGLAHWSYKDWGENLIDAWVLSLAASAPAAFHVVAKTRRDVAKDGGDEPPLAHLPVPRRNKLVGHVVQAERDAVVGAGRTGMTLESLRETALYLASATGRKKYPNLAFFLHDPFLGRETLSRLSGHLIDPFKSSGIYPIHVFFGLDEVETLRLRIAHEAASAKARMAGSGQGIDGFLEMRARQTCGGLIAGFAEAAKAAAKEGGPLWQIATSILIEAGGRRRSALVSAGCGSLVADAMQHLDRWEGLEAFPHSDLRLAPVSAPPPAGKGDVVWSLTGREAADPALCGYAGDWHHLVRGMLYPTENEADAAKPLRSSGSNLAEALASGQFLAAVKKRIKAGAKKPARKRD